MQFSRKDIIEDIKSAARKEQDSLESQVTLDEFSYMEEQSEIKLPYLGKTEKIF